MWFWKRRKSNHVIKQECYDKLPLKEKINWVPNPATPGKTEEGNEATHEVKTDDAGNFMLSALIAETTGSTLLGAVAGGSLTGALVGEMLSPEEHKVEFEGGSAGGGGAEGNFTPAIAPDDGPNYEGNNSDTTSYEDSSSYSDGDSYSSSDSSGFDSGN